MSGGHPEGCTCMEVYGENPACPHHGNLALIKRLRAPADDGVPIKVCRLLDEAADWIEEAIDRATPPAPSSDKPLMRDDAVGEVAWMLRHVGSGELLNGVWASQSEAENDAPSLGVSGEIEALPVYDRAPQLAEEYTALDVWQELVEYDDRTSPAEYPDMALITFEELKQFMSAAHWERATLAPVEEQSS